MEKTKDAIIITLLIAGILVAAYGFVAAFFTVGRLILKAL